MAVIATVSATSGTGSTVTSSAIDTTGATCIFIVQGWYSGGSGISSFTDSNGNTWTARTTYSGGSFSAVRIMYCRLPTVGSGHTFSQTSAAGYGSFCVLAMDDDLEASPFDVENGGGAASVTTRQPGSVTPTQNGELCIVGSTFQPAGSTISIDGGYSIGVQETPQSGISFGCGVAWLLQTTAAATNPTVTCSSSGDLAACIATFKVTGGGGGGGTTPLGIITPNQGIAFASAARRSI